MWGEITSPFPNFNGAAVEVWEWINNFITHFTGRVINYPSCDENQSMLVKGAPGWDCVAVYKAGDRQVISA